MVLSVTAVILREGGREGGKEGGKEFYREGPDV